MYPLPQHFHLEQEQLLAAGVKEWGSLARLQDGALRQLARQGASEQRLTRLRGQARLMEALALDAADAALLLHAGIATAAALAESSPERLQVQLTRLERALRPGALARIDRDTVRGWILRARKASSRSPN